MKIQLIHGDCLQKLKELPANSIDSVITDPPYGLSFMGKHWDKGVPDMTFWEEILRVAKPGSYLLAFGGTRTFHRLAVAIEDAGWDIRDTVSWLYGSGFPKSYDISKAIDKAAGAERKVVGIAGKSGSTRNSMAGDFAGGEYMETTPATPEAQKWEGWGTALKPAWEPIIMARKPFKGTVANNVLEWGTGGINIDKSRVEAADGTTTARKPSMVEDTSAPFGRGVCMGGNGSDIGRFPANLILDEEAGEELDAQTKAETSRFFYCAKASRKDREKGNSHPTVKPTALMEYLIKLVTAKGGTVLDPFMGSGSTGKAAKKLGYAFIGIELEEEYVEIAEARIRAVIV